MSCFILVFLCCIVVSQSQVFDTAQHENWQYLQSDYCDGVPTSRSDDGNNLCELPWTASLWLVPPINVKGWAYKCGGSILNERTILTAASCVFMKGFDVELAVVYLGVPNRHCMQARGGSCYQKIRPREVIMHDGYDQRESRLLNDIALVRLEKDIRWHECTRPICMPKGNLLQMDFEGHNATTVDYCEDINHEKSLIFQKRTLQVINSDECLPSLICVIDTGEYGQCYGDVGRPLVIQERDLSSPTQPLRDYISGILSAGGEYRGEPDAPGKFTRVSFFAEWIMDNLIENTRDYYVLPHFVLPKRPRVSRGGSGDA